MLFKEIIGVYNEKHTKPINTNAELLIVKTFWYIQLPFIYKR
jgi:hypothetical protein